MSQLIIKRLEIIRNLITLEDFEDILEHTQKLKLLYSEEDEALSQIINHLNAAGYGEAVRLIERYLQANLGLIIYSDPEVEALRLEIKHIEKEILSLQAEKSEIEMLIHKFNIAYHQKLGTLIDKLLTLKKERLRQDAEKVNADSRKRREYEDIQKDYDTFHRAYEETREAPQLSLSKAEQAELKKIFRKACLLCHPDMVAPDNIERAKRIFIELSEAYNRQDLNKVRELYAMLKSGAIFTMFTDAIDDKSLLRNKVLELRAILAQLLKDVDQLRQNDTYKLIVSIENWENYFIDVSNQLEEQITRYHLP